ncbi:unnamed protein product [Adineta ricciae]|uniref:Uncharacterized protein n=3 Tax=Adineta ricciae TaxID=249248 RepID=A0A814KAB5_ADIRI|nr:unnamed protein product [Adineta ricciae]
MAQSRSNLTVENFLNETHAELVSPNGRFVLRLEPSGNLRYLEILQSDKLLPTHLFEKSLFSTSTGDAWPGKHIVTLQSNGILQVRVKTTFLSDWKTTWTSSLLPQCKKLSTTHGFPVLSVADSGLLAIYFQHDRIEHLCVLHPEIIYQSNTVPAQMTTSSKGKSPRLAMVIAGFFRSNTIACQSHVEKLIKKWQQMHGVSVDVFIFTYVQEAHLPNNKVVNNETILAELNKCYKDNLKGVRIRNVNEIEEAFSGVDASHVTQCGGKLNRLQSQLKTVYLAGQLMRNYMLIEGITYDYVLRLRPDTNFWGTIPDLPVFGTFDNEARILLPHPYREHYYWCSHHDGRIRTGVTDQMAYGTLTNMQIYLNMYVGFSDFVRIVTGQYTDGGKQTKHNTMACEGTVGDNGCDRPNADRCAIECLVSYYLVLWGLDPEISWTWQQNVLRTNGAHSKDCGRPYNC